MTCLFCTVRETLLVHPFDRSGPRNCDQMKTNSSRESSLQCFELDTDTRQASSVMKVGCFRLQLPLGIDHASERKGSIAENVMDPAGLLLLWFNESDPWSSWYSAQDRCSERQSRNVNFITLRLRCMIISHPLPLPSGLAFQVPLKRATVLYTHVVRHNCSPPVGNDLSDNDFLGEPSQVDDWSLWWAQ